MFLVLPSAGSTGISRLLQKTLSGETMDKWIHSIVDKKIEQGEFSKSKRDLYIYGYTLLLEKTIIILITITIAVIFKAYWEIIILCIAFIPLRQYARLSCQNAVGMFGSISLVYDRGCFMDWFCKKPFDFSV